jgi:hypothetical protein
MKSFHPFQAIAALLLISSAVSAQPSIGGFKVYYGGFHSHSNVSDGTGTPNEAYNYAKNVSHLDFFSLADHSDQYGAINDNEWVAMKTAADAYNEPGVFTSFRGFEWSNPIYGHVTVMNSDNYCTTSSPTNTFIGLCDWINTRECIAFFNHPGFANSLGMEFSHLETTPNSKFIGIELWCMDLDFSTYYYNDGYFTNDGNKGYYDEALIRSWKIGALGSEDNHVATWGKLNDHRMAILANANTREEIYSALKAKRFYSTLDKNLALSFNINGNEMGSTVLPGNYGIHILASDGDGELFTQVQLLKNGTVVNTWTPNLATPDITSTISSVNNDYYYVRVRQADGDEAVSSPIWVSDGNQPPVVSVSSPATGAIFTAPASVAITASATDTDGTIAKVDFYQGSTLLSSDNTSPYSFTWTNVTAGNYTITAKATDNQGASTSSTPISITIANVGELVTRSVIIATSLDDVEENAAGGINTNSWDIELVYDSYESAGNQTVGLRFVNLAIPQNAIISNAYMQFTSNAVTTGTCNLVIKGEAADNSAAFTTTSYNVSARTKTTASVNWTPMAWSTIYAATPDQRTPDISSVIQEIVKRSGYTSSSPISIIITGSGTRTAISYDEVPALAAKLVVTYVVPGTNQPPVVSVSRPVTGATFTTPVSVTIDASATDNDGTITKVDFYQGSTLLGSDNTSPYSFTWTNVAVGNYTITVKATDNAGASTTSTPVTVAVVSNQPPVVSISSPVPGAIFTAPASVTLIASATDPDGTIAKVDFYYAGTLLGSDNTSPYSYTGTNVSVGSYTVTAVATDNTGASTTSSPVTFVVLSNQSPVVSITSPVSGATFTAPATVNLIASATDPDGTIAKVDFYYAGTLLGSDNTSPYSYTGTNVSVGSYPVTAVATDNAGATKTSAPVTITVVVNQPPVLFIISPASGATFTAPASVTINATATDADGTITKVDFYQGTTLLSSDNTSPYSFTWTNVAAGSYSLTAKATDNAGAVTTSTTVTISVVGSNQPPVVSITSPVSGATFTPPASVTINATATDADGTITKVDFYMGTTLLSSDNTSPYSFTWTNVAAGNYSLTAKATDNAGAYTISQAVNIIINPPAGAYTFTGRIQAGSDDVEESSSGSMLLNSNDIELVYDTYSTGNQIVGLRFNGVSIPKGATVTSAFIQFTADKANLWTCRLTIKGEKTGNAQSFSSTLKNVSNRAKTTASVSWNPSAWLKINESGAAQKTPDLKGVVQEIIDLSGWNSMNSMDFIITGSGTRTAASYEAAVAEAALLTINYTVPGTISTLKMGALGNPNKSGIVENQITEISSKSGNLVCYPVPFNSELHIEFFPGEGEYIKAIEIFNSVGKCILNGMQNDNQIIIDLSNLKSGIFVVRVRSNKGLYNRLVIKN